MRSEPLPEAASHLTALADEIDSTRGRVTLTRADGPELVLLSADDLDSLEETLFWCGYDLDRVRAGEPLDDDPAEPGLDEAGARELLAELLRRSGSAQD